MNVHLSHLTLQSFTHVTDTLTNIQTFVKSHHKVGVLKVKQGQTTEEDIFANGHEPGPFDEFLTVLGMYVGAICSHCVFASFL